MEPAELEQSERVAEPGQAICPGPAGRGPAPLPPRPWEEIAASAVGLLADAPAESICLQELRPLTESLDWELGQLSWNCRASRAFFADGVPFAATSSGWLASNAAEVLFTALAEAEQRGPLPAVVSVLEVGAGLGLFARGLLSAFRDLCLAREADYYGRLRYIVTDKSERMVDALRRSHVLDAHDGRIELRRLDALDVGDALEASGPLHAAFFNYVLDSLPATVLRADESGLRELCVETRLARKAKLADYTDMSVDEIVRRARSDRAEDRAALADVHDLLAAVCRLRPTSADRVPLGSFVAARAEPGRYVLHNHGALECLEGVVPGVHPDGFVLIADYGQSDGIASEKPWQARRFGSSLAIGLNFPLLEAWCREALGCDCVVPPDEAGALHCRLVGRGMGEPVAERFRRLFGGEARAWQREPLIQARACVKRRDGDGARRAFAEAVRRQGPNWALLDEVARFLVYTAADYARGLDMAALALELNPISPDLWNTYGDALYYLGRMAEARSAIDGSLRRTPENPRALLSLAYVHAAQHDPRAALRAIADGLHHDNRDAYRKGLLAEQQTILNALSRRREPRRNAQAARSESLAFVEAGGEPDGPPQSHPSSDAPGS